jgi:acid phosphatase type 7
VNGSFRRHRHASAAAVVALALVSAGATVSQSAAIEAGGVRGGGAEAAAADPVVAAAGDIACGRDSTGASCQERQTSDLLVQMTPAAVLPLGDVQYERGELIDFFNGQPTVANTGYDRTWGRLKATTRPVVGNHEYGTAGAAGFFDYFNGPGQTNGPAGDRRRGYYSFNVGNWHVVALNSNCSVIQPPGCDAGSAQERWLRADLAAHRTDCTLAYMHHPRWTSDRNPSFDTVHVQALVKALYDFGAEVLLAGHSHNYERFAPQTPSQKLDRPRGIRQIVIGTGGRNHTSFGTIEPNSEVRNASTFGVLKLTLHPTSYDWAFVPIAGQTFRDSGSDVCHQPAPDTIPPTAPASAGAAVGSAFPTAVGSLFQNGPSFPVTWGGAADQQSGVATYSVSYRQAPFNGGFGAWTPFKTGVPAGSAMFTGRLGSTYCFRATATDYSGNTSPPSPEGCTSVPADNVSLKHRGGWAKKHGEGHYLNSFSQTRRRGASLRLVVGEAKHLAIIVARCPSCGAIKVFFEGKLIKKIRLRARSMEKMQLIDLTSPDVGQGGTVWVRVVSRGRIVRIDGLGVSAV